MRFLAFSLPLFALAACGDSVPLGDFDDELNERLCQAAVDCGQMPDLATCLAATDLFDTDQFEADEENGLIDYDADQADACLDALVATFGSCEILTPGVDNGVDEACEAIVSGKVPLGGDCREDNHCEGDASCEKSCFETCCLGTCVAENPDPPPAEIGQNCSEAECVAGAYCDDAGVPTCTARIALGDPCAQFDACVGGAFCDIDFMTQMGTCITLPDEGDTCDPDSFLSLCKRLDNFCDATSSTCIKRGGPGEPCETSTECLDWTYCGTDSTCVAKPTEGQACDDVTIECLGDLECMSGSCAFEPADPVCTEPI